jgi:acyl-CoA synthetase (AMP-forming)/AMP-acid ligase II
VATDRSTVDEVHAYRGAPFAETGLPATIVSYIAEHARARGDATYITAVSATGETDELTYAELDRRTARLAHWARNELDAQHGVTLAFLPQNDLPSVTAILGLLRTGASVLLVNPTDPVGRVAEQAATLDARLLRSPTVDPDRHPGARAAPDSAALNDPETPWTDPPVDAAADALLFGTSGSTATSKLVAQSHANAVANAHAVGRHHGLAPGVRVLGCLPINHVNGLHFTVLATLAAGGHAMLAHGFDPTGYPDLVRSFRPRLASVVPSILEVLAGSWRGAPPPRELAYFLSAAAPLTARTARAVVESLRVPVVQGYGLTETTNFSTTLPTDLPAHVYRRLMLDARIPSIGTALHGNEVAVLDADGEPVPPGEAGEICMRGHNVMSRYAANPEATDEAFAGGWFHSGDLGHAIEESGRTFFVITGRRKNIAKVSGEAVSLDEMDRVLRALPAVKDAACVSLPHRLMGEEVVACVVLEGDGGGPDLRAELGKTFSSAVLPRRVLALDSLPRTPTGKIRRRELAATAVSKLSPG